MLWQSCDAGRWPPDIVVVRELSFGNQYLKIAKIIVPLPTSSYNLVAAFRHRFSVSILIKLKTFI
jgi:hypothetical protein